MATVTGNSVGAYRTKFERSDKTHLERTRRIREEVLANTSLPDLDRLVLGLTGSGEVLDKYHRLAAKIGEHAGKPIISIQNVGENIVHEASGGILTGDLLVEEGRVPSARSSESEPRIDSVRFRARLQFGASYMGPSSTSILGGEEERLFVGEETSLYDRQSQMYSLGLGFIHDVVYKNKTNELSDDYSIYESAVHIGRPEIYESPYFAHGVSKLLAHIEDL